MADTIRALTPAEVAERLHLHLRTVQRLIANGSLRAIRVGRVWRVPLQAVEEFLSGARIVPLQGGRPAPPPSEAERLARIDAACGFLQGSGHTVDDFLREKHEETEREEERYRCRHGEAA